MTGWIDIKVAKPAHGACVLICAGEVVTVATADSTFFKGAKIWWGPPCHRERVEIVFSSTGDYYWDWTFDTNDITHWMPLPSPPVKSPT